MAKKYSRHCLLCQRFEFFCSWPQYTCIHLGREQKNSNCWHNKQCLEYFSRFQSPYCMHGIWHWTTGKVTFNFTLMTMHFPSHWIFWKCNLPSLVECFQYNNRLHITVCFINFSRHSIIVDRARSTGHIILTQNSTHSKILPLIFNVQQTSSDNG